MAEFDEDAHPRDEHGKFSSGGGGGSGVKAWAAGEKPGVRGLKAEAKTATKNAMIIGGGISAGTFRAAEAHDTAAALHKDVAAAQKDGPAKDLSLAMAAKHEALAARHRENASSSLHHEAMAQAEAAKAGEKGGKREWVGEQVSPTSMEFRGQFAGRSNETIKDHFINGKPSETRADFHQEHIVGPAFEGKKTAAELGEKPTAILTMGGPASGKGVILDKLHANGLDKTHYIHVDPDEVKKALPEYKAQVPEHSGRTFMGAAAQVHEESSYVAKQIRDKAIEGGHHLIIDGTGGNAQKFIELMDHLKSKGYDVHVHHPDLGEEEGVKRALSRAERSGRHVPEPFIRDTYQKIAAGADKIAAAAPHYTRYDAADGHRPVERK